MAGPFAVFLLVLGAWYLVSYGVLDPDRRFLMPPPHEVITDGLLGDQADEMWQGLARTAGVAPDRSDRGDGDRYDVGGGDGPVQTAGERAVSVCGGAAILPVLHWFRWSASGSVSGSGARVFVCVLIALFPIVSNTLFGLVGRSTPAGPVRSAQTGPLDDAQCCTFPRRCTRDLRRAESLGGLAVVGAIVGDFFFKQGEPGIRCADRLSLPPAGAGTVRLHRARPLLGIVSSSGSSAGCRTASSAAGTRKAPTPEHSSWFLTGHLFLPKRFEETWPSAHCTRVSRYVGMAAIAATVAAATVACRFRMTPAPDPATPAPSARVDLSRCAPPDRRADRLGTRNEHGHLYSVARAGRQDRRRRQEGRRAAVHRR